MNDVSSIVHQGCKIAYRVRGSGPPALFIQGVNTHGDGWNPQVNDLAGRYACLTFDNRGTGGSDRGSEPITVEQMAADAAAVMRAVGWESAHVVGHSLGGPVGLQLALTARKRVRSLALLCSFADGKGVGPLSWRLIWAGMRMRFGTKGMKRRAFLDLVVPPGTKGDRNALAAELAPLFGHDLAEPLLVLKDQMKAMWAFDVNGRLGELAGLRTLVANAEFDPIAPPKLGRGVAAGIPGARYVNLDGASHGVILTDPKRVNALLVEHFGEGG
ncbi:alpha beta hydrolase fold protein : Alpha/beta hydrolase fold protein OS=Chondromyces apiculatus DSM 436 GN=CAP_1545 PE=4 SV=1: Abhydrolase_6 [Gemmata massiliana]|uniref:AB hydrolase-1 domain-containing protein n=1 Tax=Gemmata massiliana TaxID=1210884 RepID=A0A6P2CSL0_9BACT|nr:alpha/beta hydrolase [Gemmata massiliana]VTR91597.1 alpha beta hydrolase fold protein : Alpha/beta hydrolase fold protein OS=Chondromyces apiculatus DSM 436 GN=CAP_1545 PE=4 SV=1: Abhydrolase_6 [Gemmata massiliana]